MNKRRLLKLADFIEKLPPRKLNMEVVTQLNGSKKMDPYKCNSAACAMGWTPAVFPKLIKWELWEHYFNATNNYSTNDCVVNMDGHPNELGICALFEIPYLDATKLFGRGTDNYHTPKQVGRGLREYVKTGKVPNRCWEAL